MLPIAETASPNGYATGVAQRLTITFGVLLMLAAVGKPDKLTALETLREATRRALTGYTPDGATTPIRLEGGELADLDDGLLVWLERFALDTHWRQ